MPSLPRSVGRRALAAAVLATAVLVAWLAPAVAEPPGIEVTIQTAKGSDVTVHVNRLNPDVNTDYPIRERGKPERRVEVEDGVSIWNILRSRSLDDDDYGFVEIERRNGTTLRIESSDVDDAFFYETASGEPRFFRVSRSAEDYNARDHFEVESAVRLTQTAELEVDLSADRRKIEPGESVDFDAEVSGGPPGARYELSWNFGDGSRESGSSPERSHVFDEQGIYSVTVTAKVRGSNLSGDGNVVDVEVGDPEKEPEDDVPSGSGRSDGGAYVPSSPTPYTPSYTPPATSTPPSPAPAPTPTPKPPKPPDISTSGGTTVEGSLLADVGDRSPSSVLDSAARAARDEDPREEDASDGADISEAALSIAGVLALLGLGAGLETRQRGRPRFRLPHLALPRRGA